MFSIPDLRDYYYDYGILNARSAVVLLALWSIYRIGLGIYRGLPCRQQ